MNLVDLKKLVRRGEGDQVEFKRKAKYPEKIVSEIVAFANTQGGKLIIGVDDNLSIPGVKFPEEDHFVLAKAIKELIKPTLEYSHEFLKLSNGSSVVIYDIPESSIKPHFAHLTVKHRSGKAYVRIADKSIQASREFRNVLKLQRNKDQALFQFGEEEQKLMKFVDKNGGITLREYEDISNLSGKRASEVLVNLTAHNILRIVPGEHEDVFLAKIDNTDSDILPY